MNIDVISVVLCNLDINKYEKVGSRLLPSEQKRVVQYWKRFTTYEVKEDTSRKKEWYRNGKLHRDGDLPAIVWKNGGKEWYKNGKYHRDGDLPAIEYADGDKYWWKNGKLHRDGDLPAIEYAKGKKYKKYWYKNGKEYYPS